MARFVHQAILRDGNGKSVKEATMTVYLAGATTAATIYESETGDELEDGQTTTGTNGTYSFWVDTDDYDTTQRFDIYGVKTNYTIEPLLSVCVFPYGYSA